MGKKRNTQGRGVGAIIPPEPQVPAQPALAIDPDSAEVLNRFMNSFSDAIGLGGGVSPNPFGQLGVGTAVENIGTVFKNLRWQLVSNMRQVLSQAYVEIGLVQTICDVPVDDALRGGVQIKSAQLSEDQIGELRTRMRRDKVLATVGLGGKWDRLFGGAGLLILTDQDPEEPLDLDAIGEGTPLDFRAVDLWELFWDRQGSEGTNPVLDAEDLNDFEHYNYYGEKVHKTRVMRLDGLTPPSFIRPRLRGWGFSVVEILVRSINQYLKATDLAFEVLDEFKVDVYKIAGLTQALASPLGVEQVKKRVQLANWEKNYNNALTMDKEDDWDHKQLSFSGLGDAMMQIRMQVASDMRMPITKLFGISAAGFNSGEDDIEVYNAMVESQIRAKLEPIILRTIELLCQKYFGFIPDDLAISFEPLRYMSSEQEENVKTQQFSRLLQAFQAGVIDLKEFREAINKGELFDITLSNANADLMAAYMDTLTDVGENPDAAADGGGQDAPDAKDAKDSKPKEAKGAPKAKDKVENSLLIMPKPWTTSDRAKRAVSNSATFDRKAYEAVGGDGWINPKRKHFFDRDKAQDRALWDRGEQASRDALGEVRWQFVVWFYKKFGGSFSQVRGAS